MEHTDVCWMVLFRSGSANLNAYLPHPEGEGPFPGLMVIHEVFGLNDNVKRIADRFAGEGYWALVVRLFAGRKLNATLERHSIPHDVKGYPSARHSFFNDESRNHDPAASEDSWRRTLAFFEEHIC